MTSAIHDDGYIKYDCRWTKHSIVIPEPYFSEINHCRDRLYLLGLIGAYPEDGIGFGNISMRADYSRREFWISGSSTGHLPKLSQHDYSRVTNFDIAKNRVWSWGANQASSESMSHAVLYRADRNIGAVVHVHNASLWEKMIYQVPTTDASIAYGTPEMALAIEKLYQTSDLPTQKILVMGGHQDGVIAFGKNIAEAAERIINLYEEIK